MVVKNTVVCELEKINVNNLENKEQNIVNGNQSPYRRQVGIRCYNLDHD